MSAAQSLAFALLAAGCATGGKDGGDGVIDAPRPIDGSPIVVDAPRAIDAPNVSMTDAPILVDAPVMIDAPSGPFCTANNQCTVAGECCLTLGGPQGFCAEGTIVLGSCVPPL